MPFPVFFSNQDKERQQIFCYAGIMKKFEYDITKHPASEFTHLVYFCTAQGECKFDQIPEGQTKVLGEILNERGAQGWELVHLAFGKDGLVCFWKRERT